jgi:hypothetical protein
MMKGAKWSCRACSSALVMKRMSITIMLDTWVGWGGWVGVGVGWGVRVRYMLESALQGSPNARRALLRAPVAEGGASGGRTVSSRKLASSTPASAPCPGTAAPTQIALTWRGVRGVVRAKKVVPRATALAFGPSPALQVQQRRPPASAPAPPHLARQHVEGVLEHQRVKAGAHHALLAGVQSAQEPGGREGLRMGGAFG